MQAKLAAGKWSRLSVTSNMSSRRPHVASGASRRAVPDKTALFPARGDHFLICHGRGQLLHVHMAPWRD